MSTKCQHYHFPQLYLPEGQVSCISQKVSQPAESANNIKKMPQNKEYFGTGQKSIISLHQHWAYGLCPFISNLGIMPRGT